MKKLLVLFLFILIIVILYFLTPLHYYLSSDGFKVLQQWIESTGMWAPLIFGSIYVVATIFALPGSVLTISGGLLFGPLWGTVINWMSASIGATGSFLIARYLGREAVTRFLRKQSYLERLDDKIGKNGFYSVFILRLVPLFPFNALNYGLGLTRVSLIHYVGATLLGMLPGTFVYTSLGAAGRHISLRDPTTWTRIEVWGPFLLVIILSLLPKIIKKKNIET